jgi:acetyl-CoA decarbonylase/synthase complex subunit gamma
MDQPFVEGPLKTSRDEVPRVTSSLKPADHWGTFKARWGVGRMRYTVDPGLYALGEPNETSPVLVTANYKMSFDRLRKSLPGLNAWILVLDTKGINVWCAAGKGTFGTEELVRRIQGHGLELRVNHRELILPQLSGPGIAAYQVKKQSGFKVIYGPVRALDIPAFLENGLTATTDMRLKSFPLRERIVLIPVELVSALKWYLIIAPLFFLLGGLGSSTTFWQGLLNDGLFSIIAMLCALTAGAVITPILLPWIPGRAFSLKGLILGLITAGILTSLRGGTLATWADRLEYISWFFLIPAAAAYLAMNFTGASTYTSLSGVRKEMKWAVPVEIALGSAGFCLWLGSRFIF